MLAPYEGEPDNSGIVVTSADKLWSTIVAAGEAGFPMSVHAIGDRAVREVLDVMGEWATTRGATARLPIPSGMPMPSGMAVPQRIEHVQLLSLIHI